MSAAEYLLTLGTAAGLAFLIVLGLGIGAHAARLGRAARLRRLGFTVIREDDHE